MTVSIKAAGYNFTKFRRKLFNPVDRYAGGAQGAIWNLQDITKLWQNVGRTVPAVVGQQVHAIDDISGRNLHLLKNTTNGCVLGQKPDGRYYLIATGAENYVTATLTHSAMQKAFMACGFMPTDGGATARGLMINSSNLQAPVGTFGVWVSGTANLVLQHTGASGPTADIKTPAPPLLLARKVMSCYVDVSLSSNEVAIKINNAVPGSLSGNTGTTDCTTTNFGAWPFYLFGGYSSGNFVGEWFGGLLHFGASDAEQQSDFANYVNELTGAY